MAYGTNFEAGRAGVAGLTGEFSPRDLSAYGQVNAWQRQHYLDSQREEQVAYLRAASGLFTGSNKYDKPKNFKEELQNEIDEWLKGVFEWYLT